MKFSSIIALTSIGLAAQAAPLSPRTSTPSIADLEPLGKICSAIDGTLVTDVLCQTVSGTDISVAAATDGGLAKVTIRGDGLLKGSSITVPVGSLESVLHQLGIFSLDSTKRSVDVDLGGAGLSLKRSEADVNAERSVDVDLGGAGLSVKRSEADVNAERSVDVDLLGAGISVKRSEADVNAERSVDVDLLGAGISV